MSLRYIVTVTDYDVQGFMAKTVRRRSFRNLAIARHFEKKFYHKALRRPGMSGRIERWGSAVSFVNGGNYSEVTFQWMKVRTITITCEGT